MKKKCVLGGGGGGGEYSRNKKKQREQCLRMASPIGDDPNRNLNEIRG